MFSANFAENIHNHTIEDHKSTILCHNQDMSAMVGWLAAIQLNSNFSFNVSLYTRVSLVW